MVRVRGQWEAQAREARKLTERKGSRELQGVPSGTPFFVGRRNSMKHESRLATEAL